MIWNGSSSRTERLEFVEVAGGGGAGKKIPDEKTGRETLLHCPGATGAFQSRTPSVLLN